MIATIGPAMKDREMIKEIMIHQMDIARLNFPWGTYAEHAEYIKNIRDAAH